MLALQATIGNRAVSGLLQRAKPGSERPERKAKLDSPYSGKPHFKSERLRKKHGGNSTPRRPVVDDFGRLLWAGNRPSFWDVTVDNVLRAKGQSINQVSPAGGNRAAYKCKKCGNWFPRKRDAVGQELTIDLDHDPHWRRVVGDDCEPVSFHDPHGHHWEAYRWNDVVNAYNNENKLWPMCSHDNRSKSGPKNIDLEKPTHLDKDCGACLTVKSERLRHA